ncbi:MAG: hypothetical protein J4F39_17420 [Candidatus Latescibacteria bacterium]|nr:hypothetical protein [Candidatus Latescibacterota bacterium]
MASFNTVRVGSTHSLIAWILILLFGCTYRPVSAGEFVEVSEVNLESVPDRESMRITDVAMGRGGIVYICDKARGQVFRVSTQLNRAEVIRPKTRKNEQSWRPRAIAVDKEGMLYIAEETEVWIFDIEGRVVDKFDTEIANPTSIAVTVDGTTYVAGFNEGYVLYRYDSERSAKLLLGHSDQDVRVIIGSLSGGMVRTWESGVLFGANTPYELVALGNEGNVTKTQLRPELNLGTRVKFDKSANTAMVQISSSGSALSIATNDSLIYYCYSPRESGLFTDISRVYVDVYDRHLKPIGTDINIDGAILAADRDGYVYFAKKNQRGMDGLFRGKFKHGSFK